jgi:hypothetical protein
MNFDYFIFDDFLLDPKSINQYLKTQEYYSSPKNKINNHSNIPIKNQNNVIKAIEDPRGQEVYWLGYRSGELLYTNPVVHRIIFDNLFKKIFNNFFISNINFTSECYFHLFTEDFTPDDSWYHRDTSAIIAGVLYLSENPSSNSGTLLDINNNKIEIENIFNRLVIYNGMIPHRVNGVFGNSIENCRSSLNFFIQSISLNPDLNGKN